MTALCKIVLLYCIIIKAFNSLCYTADGAGLVAAGRSKFICVYSVEDQLLMKKFEISRNLSLDGIQVCGVVVLVLWSCSLFFFHF